MSLSTIIWIFLGFLAVRFVLKFLLPIFVVTRKMRQQVQDAMKHAQQQQQAARQNYQSHATSGTATPQQKPPKEKSGDYIDFEEVK